MTEFLQASVRPNVHLPYGQSSQPHHRVLAALAAKYTPAGRVLEVGCGLGYSLSELQRVNPDLELSGADIDDVCLQETARKSPGVSLVRVDDGHFDLATLGGGYDTIMMSHVLEHLPHPLRSIEELLGLLAPGGHLILGVPNALTPTNIIGSLFRRYRVNPGHLHTWDFRHWMNFLENWVPAEVVEYRGDEVRIFPGRLKRLRLVQAAQAALGRLVPAWTFTNFAVLRRREEDHEAPPR